MKRRHSAALLFVALAAVAALFPLVFTVASSFMSGEEIASRYTAEITQANAEDFASNGIHFVRFGLLPEEPTLEQYRELLFDSPEYLRMFWNSVLLVAPVLLGQVVLAPLAAYGLERIRWRYKEAIFFTRYLRVDRHAHAHPAAAGAQLHCGGVAEYPGELPGHHPAGHVPPPGSVFNPPAAEKTSPRSAWRPPPWMGRGCSRPIGTWCVPT